MDFKQEYIRMRNLKSYDLGFFYRYYLSKGGKMTDPDEFTETFMFTHMKQQMPAGYPSMRMRTGEIDRDKILDFMDYTFGLSILKDKEGQFIKVVE